MKTYTLSGAQAGEHRPAHPERTARRNAGTSADMNFDVVFRVWPSRGAMLTTINMQARRESSFRDWRPVVACVSQHRPDARCNCEECYK